jgi:catechol 2,3-dioxygenase-like lactoylglutathione lyase family enzyme
MVLANLQVRQIAYFCPDIAAAALSHSASFGSGPFFIGRNVPLAWSEHRGVRVRHDHTSAYGQWGDVMVEFVQQHGADPSAFHDLFPHDSGRFGLHHVAVWVDRLDEALVEFANAGMPLAQLSETAGGTRYAFVDATASLGHMFELYEPTPGLVGFYAMVAKAAENWDGRDPIRELG